MISRFLTPLFRLNGVDHGEARLLSFFLSFFWGGCDMTDENFMQERPSLTRFSCEYIAGGFGCSVRIKAHIRPMPDRFLKTSYWNEGALRIA